MKRRNGNKDQSESSSLSSKKGIQESSEPCDICGSVSIAGLMMICFKCRHTREHTYCARGFLSSVPDIWQCEACRFSSRVSFISHVADDLMDSETTVADPRNTSNSRVDTPKDTLLSQKREHHHQPTQAFPKKRRTIRVMGKHHSQSHDRTQISPLDQIFNRSASPK
ncbi:hypothetical protein N665_0502s0028 [Sinapis alba]|nr:hypothetical protein N665_0502s0028 [Sinapis alba]